MAIDSSIIWKGFTTNTPRSEIVAAMGVAEEQLEIIEAGCIIIARVKEDDDGKNAIT